MSTKQKIDIRDLVPSNTCSGAQSAVYFDPDRLIVWEFGTIGNGMPMSAFHGRDLCLGSVNIMTASDEVYRSFIENSESRFLQVAEGFSEEWDGSNMVGLLTPEALKIFEDLQREWEDLEPETFWHPSDWLDPVRAEVREELLSEGFDLSDWVSEQVSYAKAEGAYLCPEDVQKEALDMLERFVHDLEEDEEDHEVLAKKARALALLE